MAEPIRLTPDNCREHAARCRDMARTAQNPEHRKSLEDVAASWDQLCEELAEIEKQKKP